jgi:hypothetical protein
MRWLGALRPAPLVDDRRVAAKLEENGDGRKMDETHPNHGLMLPYDGKMIVLRESDRRALNLSF